MYAMAAFDPTLIMLVGIYTDQYSAKQDANVYSNGAMQVSIFISVNYNGDTTGIESQIIEYVQTNSVIYVLETNSPLTWGKSTTSNAYYHDIDSASPEKKDPYVVSDIRAPLYFTVPVNSEGTYRWVAKLDGQETDTGTPVTVNVQEYYVTPSDFLIEDSTSYGHATLRILRYQHDSFGGTQKLRRCMKYKGVRFTSPSANAWISMIMSSKGHKAGVFLLDSQKDSAANVALNDHEYGDWDWQGQGSSSFYPTARLTSDYGWEDPQKIPVSDIQDAWNRGIPMIKIEEDRLYMYHWEEGHIDGWVKDDYEMQGFLIVDTFGNRVEINMNWDVGDWWGNWAVSKATVKYP